MYSPWAQAAVLVVGTLVVYRYAFFDVARADQLAYLYRTVDIHGLWNLTVGAYDFNRTHSIGDFLLFRPILYMLLGLERWLWGYDFLAWQATSIGLHILVVLSLFCYFRSVCKRFTWAEDASLAPFVLAIFFAFLYAGTEQVAWHHIVGYLLFCFLAVQALFAYQRILDRRDALNAALIVILSGLACFTYELGDAMAGLLALALITTVIAERSLLRAGSQLKAGHTTLIVTAILLLIWPIVYASWSYLNYVAIFGALPYRPPVTNPAVIWLTVESIGAWTLTTLVPGLFVLEPGLRIDAHATGHIPPVSAGIACITLLSAVTLLIKKRAPLDIIPSWISAATALLVALAFALIISVGRGVERGEIYVLGANTNYTYIFALFLVCGFFHVVAVRTEAGRHGVLFFAWSFLLTSLSAIALISGAKTYALHETMYRTYSGPIGRLVRNIEVLRAEHRGEADFSFSLAPDCGNVYYLDPWFASQASLDNHHHYTIATALFPHEERDTGGKYIVHCP